MRDVRLGLELTDAPVEFEPSVRGLVGRDDNVLMRLRPKAPNVPSGTGMKLSEGVKQSQSICMYLSILPEEAEASMNYV